MCHLYLQPDDKYKCPICNSNETTLFGKKSRTFIDECYANHKTYVVITYHRIKCKQCGKMFMDTIKELLSKQSISLNLKLNKPSLNKDYLLFEALYEAYMYYEFDRLTDYLSKNL